MRFDFDSLVVFDAQMDSQGVDAKRRKKLLKSLALWNWLIKQCAFDADMFASSDREVSAEGKCQKL